VKFRLGSTSIFGFNLPKTIATVWLITLTSGLGVVYNSHHCRLLYNDLALLEQEEHHLEVLWGQYLLEENSLASLHRVESLAASELGMQVPALDQIIMVKP
jgi:cell division protein FtsL